jgi:hypothetical protein
MCARGVAFTRLNVGCYLGAELYPVKFPSCKEKKNSEAKYIAAFTTKKKWLTFG